MKNLEESTKIAKGARFAMLARQLADKHQARQPIRAELTELAILRGQEQRVTDREIAFQGLGRQIGDAARTSQPLEDLLSRLVELRRHELNG